MWSSAFDQYAITLSTRIITRIRLPELDGETLRRQETRDPASGTTVLCPQRTTERVALPCPSSVSRYAKYVQANAYNLRHVPARPQGHVSSVTWLGPLDRMLI